MDVIRSWLLAAAVYALLNYLLVVTVGHGGAVDWLHLVCPLMAGIAAGAYHAEFGIGGWGRHFVAVFSIPIAFELYSHMFRQVPQSTAEWGTVVAALGIAAAATGIGFGVVMITRLMVTTRGLWQGQYR